MRAREHEIEEERTVAAPEPAPAPPQPDPAVIEASPFTELYYARGKSQLHSAGRFELTQAGGVVTVTGTVHHRWFDPYNWNAGQAAFIPGSGLVSDDDGLLMERYRGAKPFTLEGTWDQTLSGTVTKREYWFDSHDWTWSGP
jgi:hypothetical protein